MDENARCHWIYNLQIQGYDRGWIKYCKLELRTILLLLQFCTYISWSINVTIEEYFATPPEKVQYTILASLYFRTTNISTLLQAGYGESNVLFCNSYRFSNYYFLLSILSSSLYSSFASWFWKEQCHMLFHNDFSFIFLGVF